jgi:L-ascorbate metabolism protein UlaG (beta-lactamase superfamily)
VLFGLVTKSVLIEIDGYRVFFDPMLSEYAFPVKAFAPKRMNPSQLSLSEIPIIDAVAISHDHYDHLDMKTIQHLHKQGAMFFVGLGVGAHLEKWGIPKDKVNEID